MKVVLIRHGESKANFENYWTGWLDVDLTEKGRKQAHLAGKKLKAANITFDAAFTSYLKRAQITCNTLLEASDQLWVPVYKTWRLNERHYGQLVGKNKQQIAAEFGNEQVKRWRRGFYEPPLFVTENNFDRRYNNLDERLIPKGENLAMVQKRVIPLWEDEIAPLIRQGKNILVTGHGNSLRALIKYLDNVPESQLDTIEVPNGEPIIYTFDNQLNQREHL